MNETIVTAAETAEMNTAIESPVTIEATPASAPDTVMGIGVNKLQNVALFAVGFIFGIAAAKAHQACKDWKSGKAQREKNAEVKATAAKIVEAVAEAKAEDTKTEEVTQESPEQ